MRILTAAEMVGSLATALTIYRAFKTQTPIPRTVDPFDGYLAGHLVANAVCPSAGQWCMHYDDYSDDSFVPATLPDQVNKADEAFTCFLNAVADLQAPAELPARPPGDRPSGDRP